MSINALNIEIKLTNIIKGVIILGGGYKYEQTNCRYYV